MPVISNRSLSITFSGDVNYSLQFNAIPNNNAQGIETVVSLPIGNTSIGITGMNACTIIPPVGNTTLIILKGASADQGVTLHPTDPTTVTFFAPAIAILTVLAQINGVRLIYT
jgi:hypothetical protein